MCGIAGIFRMDGQPVRDEQIAGMVDCIRHRGPDADGCWTERHVGLGHTRLAIIDLTPESNQPFHSADGRYVLTYNGEIFNYIELRKEMEGRGHRFRTRSDTEVLLQAYITWGVECLQRFNGMWAFAIYDRQKDLLFCSRDRFGIKPFVYAETDQSLLFGSEAKSLLAVAPGLRSPNYTAISHCMRRSLSGGLDDTCFQEIKRLPPAHYLIVKNSSISVARYWDYPKHADQNASYEEATERVQSLLDDSVRIRMRSDVPVGITLSSGLDSTGIAYLMRRHSDEHLLSYTSSYEDHESEASVARETSAKLNFDFSAVNCSSDGLVGRLREIVRHLETPHSSSSILPLWEIMRQAQKSVKVLMEGQGADELFAGYQQIYFPSAMFQSLRRMKIGEAAKDVFQGYKLTSGDPLLGRRYFFSNVARTMVPGSHKMIRKFGRGDEGVYIGPLKNVPDYVLPVDKSFDDLLNRRLGSAHSVELVDLLHFGDAISMAFGLESRLPFVDYRLVEAVFAMPSRFKLAGGVGKRILRSALAGLVPDHIRENLFKKGFTTPISRWLRDRPEENIYQVLLTKKCDDRNIFDRKKISRIIDQHVRGERDFGPIIFRWLTCELWFQEFIDVNAAS